MQQKRANPLYSPIGCFTTLALVLILGAFLRFRGGGPFSPGSLTAASPRGETLSGFAAHADFEEDCSLCHAAWRGVDADRCESCHTDIANQRSSGDGMHGHLPDADRCQQCHTDHKGREAAITLYALTSFEHDFLTGFSLAQHELNFDDAPFVCEDCHPRREFEARISVCSECHLAGEPTFTQNHSELYGGDCQACHDGRDTLVSFDHQTVFPLEGGHQFLACESCHAKTVLAGTSSECVGCHEEPDVHAGDFGLDCARCHTSTAWVPAHLGYHTFPLDHGEEGKIDCQTCHTDTYVEYTCYNCHAHDQEETEQKHKEEGIDAFEDCVACHPTGREAEIEEGEDD